MSTIDVMATAAQLQSIMPQLSADRAGQFAPPLDAARERFTIDSVPREAAFLAQLAHESGEFRWMKEIWGPSRWQRRYENAASLGNTQPGDGERFMGRGPIQITGRANYGACSRGLGLGAQLLDRPDLLESPEYGCLAAAWYWNSRTINAPADAGNFHRVTQLINGKRELGYEERLAYYRRALDVLGESVSDDGEDTRGPACRVVVNDDDMTKVLDPFMANDHVMVRVRPFADMIDLKIVDLSVDTVTVSDSEGNEEALAFMTIDDAGYVALHDLVTDACQWDDASHTATVSLPD